MSLHESWADAKKTAWKEFKEAHKNYLKEQDKKIKAKTDPTARKKALDMVLSDAGLDKGESLDDYLKFADGFGKSLDALEKAAANNHKLQERFDFQSGDLDKLLKDKDAAKQFMLLCQRTQNTFLITFYLKDHTKSPQEIWDQYVKPGAKDLIDFATAPKLEEDWQAAESANTLGTKGKQLIAQLRDHVKVTLQEDLIPKMVSNAEVQKALGYVPKATLDKLKKDVRDTAASYDGQIDKAAKRWKDLEPQFWVPLDEALQAIMKWADGLKA